MSFTPPAEWPAEDSSAPRPGTEPVGYVPPSFTADLLERCVRTFLQSAAAVVLADLSGLTSLDAAKGLAISALAAGLAAVMGLIGRRFGSPDNASVQG